MGSYSDCEAVERVRSQFCKRLLELEADVDYLVN